MNKHTLIRRSLRFHWRSHLGVVIGAAIGSAALIGALVVGDSVRESLKEKALSRLGHGSHLLHSPDRYFSEELSLKVRAMANARSLQNAYKLYQKTSSELPMTINPELPQRNMLIIGGTISREDTSMRLNQIQIIGIPDFVPALFTSSATAGGNPPRTLKLTNECVANSYVAARLGLANGDTVLLRFNKTAKLSPEAAISPKNEQTATLRMTVYSTVTNSEIANFSPVPTVNMPANIFVPLNQLTRAIGLPQPVDLGSVNTWLCPEVVRLQPMQRPQTRFGTVVYEWIRWVKRKLNIPTERDGLPHFQVSTSRQLSELSDLLDQNWGFDTVQIARVGESSNYVSLASERVFLDPPVVRAALTVDTNAQPILTYLVNVLRAGTNVTPYSMVTASGAPWTPADMRDEEIIVSQWLAEDLHVKAGDEIALTYFDPESGARLSERTNIFRVRSIVSMEMPWADRTLMPDFPGIEKAESTRDWDAGFPLVHKIRQKDEDYWKQHRGTPKAFVTLAAGQKMWANRFGNLTAIRFPISTNLGGTSSTSSQTSANDGDAVKLVPPHVEDFRIALEKKILANLNPEELGLRFEPVREQALKAAEESQDFGGLFLGFSFFLIIAALLLMAMLFQFGLEQRTEEIGTLLALGFTPKQVRRLLIGEGAALAFIGGVLGAIGGIVYARAMLHGLTTIWRDAVGGSLLTFHVTTQTLAIGFCASVVVSLFTIWLTMRRLMRRPARELLAGEVQSPKLKVQSRGLLLGGTVLVGAVGLAGWTLAKGDTSNAGAFFGAGSLMLIAGLSFVSGWLGGMERRALPRRDGSGPNRQEHAEAALGAPLTLASLGIRGCARRRTRSLSTVAMLACGSFLIVSIGVFRLDASRDAAKRDSGTGGFALIGDTTMPVVQDLNSQSGRNFFALNGHDLEGVNIVPFRVREGDEASCLNLNAAQRPRLLGVKPEMLIGRFSFGKFISGLKATNEWLGLIRENLSNGPSTLDSPSVFDGTIPAIGDANSIQWAMHKKVGDTIDYVDDRGQPFQVRIVGAVANSILQGSLIIDEAEFLKRFPGESGYRTFLIDAPSNSVAQVSATLSRAMQDVGLELTPAPQRLAQFNAVQNTYLGTFQVLGGLGLLLGSVGLGIVVLRNVLERRSELAVLQAVGFTKRTLQRLLLIEHGMLLITGLAIGVAAAVVAVLPSMLSPSAQLPYQSLALTLATVLVNGALWTWVAARLALRGNLLAALRNE